MAADQGRETASARRGSLIVRGCLDCMAGVVRIKRLRTSEREFAMYSIEELAKGLRTLGIRAGDTVMLHASVRAVGEVPGGPDAIHLAPRGERDGA